MRKKKILFSAGKIILTAFFLSIFIPMVINYFKHDEINATTIFKNMQWYTPKIFLSIFPIVLVVKKNYLFKDGPLKATIMIFYYIIFVPVIDNYFGNKRDENLDNFYIILSIINVGFLIVSHIILIKYSFTDIFLKKRKIVPKDIFIILTTYITFALSFGMIYLIISLISTEPAFYGIKDNPNTLTYYFRHIYFSFITISTVGYGDIYPTSVLAQILVIIEILIGIVIVNITLALILGSGIFNFKKD